MPNTFSASQRSGTNYQTGGLCPALIMIPAWHIEGSPLNPKYLQLGICGRRHVRIPGQWVLVQDSSIAVGRSLTRHLLHSHILPSWRKEEEATDNKGVRFVSIRYPCIGLNSVSLARTNPHHTLGCRTACWGFSPSAPAVGRELPRPLSLAKHNYVKNFT